MRLAWRLSLGVVALGVGILLLTGPAGDGVLAGVSALCALMGLVTLAGAVPRRFRWWCGMRSQLSPHESASAR